jgi:hypothetical protein
MQAHYIANGFAGKAVAPLRDDLGGKRKHGLGESRPTDNGTLMIWLVGIKYMSLGWPNGLARASRQSVRVAVRIPMNTRVAILGVNLLPSLRRTQFLCRSCVVFFFYHDTYLVRTWNPVGY